MPGKDDSIAIGDFSKPLVDRPSASAGSSPTEASLRASEARLDSEARKDEEQLQPLQTYADRLKSAGVDLVKAAKIVDEVLLRSFYAEDIQITKTIKMRLRTRTARDTRRIQELLEAANFRFDHHYRESLTRLLLASSLERFGDDKLPHPDKKSSADDIEKMFQERIAYIDNQVSDPALRIMFAKLFKFDQMITIALEEGAIENF
jgi:hypothetical protein